MRRLFLPALSVVALCTLGCPPDDSPANPPSEPGMPAAEEPPPADEPAAAPTESEDPLAARYRADLLRIEPGTPPERVEAEVAKFVASLAQARTEPYPSSHADCERLMRTGATRDCTMLVGDVVKPRWFAACKAAGGATVKANTPADTPLHYDREFCTQSFPVAP